MEITPEIIIAGLSVLGNLIQFLREKDTRKALETVADGVEMAATLEMNPKEAIDVQPWKPAARRALHGILKQKGLLRRRAK